MKSFLTPEQSAGLLAHLLARPDVRNMALDRLNRFDPDTLKALSAEARAAMTARDPHTGQGAAPTTPPDLPGSHTMPETRSSALPPRKIVLRTDAGAEMFMFSTPLDDRSDEQALVDAGAFAAGVGNIRPTYVRTVPPHPGLANPARTDALLEGAAAISRLPRDYECDPGRGNAADLLRRMAADTATSTGLSDVLRIVTETVTEANDVGGVDLNDLVDRLADNGYPLPDLTNR